MPNYKIHKRKSITIMYLMTFIESKVSEKVEKIELY